MRRSLPTGSEPEHWPPSENPLGAKFREQPFPRTTLLRGWVKRLASHLTAYDTR
jgi:hypothetical protein